MNIKTTEYNVSARVSKKLTFVFVSDLHGCDNTPILNAIKNVNPDAVLVGGDFVHSTAVYKAGIEFLKMSSNLIPTFCSLGNHERNFEGDIRRLVKKTGAVMLDNSYINFHGVFIGGLTSVSSKNNETPDIRWLETFSYVDNCKILLCHHPEYYERYIKGLDIDLVLSGHAHGGQWRFFGRGVYSPGQGIFPKYTSGLYDGQLLVSCGIGNPHLIPRINNAPEVLCVRLSNN